MGLHGLPGMLGSAMSPTEQQLAIQEMCGWKRTRNGNGKHWNHPNPNQKATVRYKPWNYLTNLNAMHQAERVLQAQNRYWPDYIYELSQLFPPLLKGEDKTNWSQMCHATAAQRAEAFLRAVKKWRDS